MFHSICRIFIRYAFIPFLQLETPTFRRLGKAFIEGMSFFIPFSSYESRFFLAKRLAGVPGYQYDVDISKEVFQRQIFNDEEAKLLVEQFQNDPGREYRRNMVFDKKMYLLEIMRIDDQKTGSENNFGHYTNLDDNNNNNNNEEPATCDRDIKSLMKLMGLKHPSEILITEVDETNIKMYLNDRKFKDLSAMDQFLVKAGNHHAKMIENRFTKPLYEAALSFYIFMMEKYQQIF